MDNKSCYGCPCISDKDCGKIVVVRESAGAISYKKEKDNRCKRRR